MLVALYQIEMSFQKGHILLLRVDSSVVDGLVSLIFDVLLLSICNFLSQAICSHYIIHTVYNAQRPLSLHSTRVLYFGHGLVGPERISRILCFILSIATLTVIILGLSIKGRTAGVYRSFVGIASPPLVAQLDYENEYELGEEQFVLRPNFISRRLVAFTLMDKCWTCRYSHCAYMGISFTDEEVNGQLVPSWATIEKWSHSKSVQCVMDKAVTVSWTDITKKSPAHLQCELESIEVPDEGSFIKGTPKGKCDLFLKDVRCYRRRKQGGPKIAVHCAALGKADGADSLYLIVFLDAKHIRNVEIAPFAMSKHVNLPSEQIETYLKNVAFFSSLDLGPAPKLDLMAFSTVIYNAELETPNANMVNVTEVDLRIAIPCLVILFLTLTVLCLVFMTTWILIVHSKKRKHFNSLSTVSEILELLLPCSEALEPNSSNRCPPPSIGILRESLRIGVRRSWSDFILPDERRIEEWRAAECWV